MNEQFERIYKKTEDFVEELKKLNKKFIDRRDFRILINNDIVKKWNRK